MSSNITIVKDYPNNMIVVKTSINTSKEKVWNAFTQSAILEKWWAPLPYKAVTKTMNFSNGGQWLYYMLSPEGDKHWCLADFSNIVPGISYTVLDAFCDENGNITTPPFPRMHWENRFTEKNAITEVTNIIRFEKEEHLKQILEMGFEEGFSLGLQQLTQLLEG